MSVGTCRLCQETVPLRDSHVFPEFLYYSIYDDRHRAIGLAPFRDVKEKPVYQGLREPLLGDCCEGRLQKLESYAARAMRRLPDASAVRPGKVVVAQNVEYRQFKLFQLSLIWRAGVATQPSFAQVDLGPHEPTIRGMLLARDPGEPLDYPCLLLRPYGPESLSGIVKFPGRSHIMTHRIFHMVAAGLIWIFFVSSHTRSIREHRSFLSASDELPINISSGTAAGFLQGLGQNLRTLGIL